MNNLELMLLGEIEMMDFVKSLKEDRNLQNIINNLIPDEAKSNPKHDIWKKISYQTYSKYKYDIPQYILLNRKLDNSIADNLNIFGSISIFYSYWHPDAKLTSKYCDAFDLYLSAIKDCFDGPEVEHIVNSIIDNALLLKYKKDRLAQAKNDISMMFHVTDNKYPRWIQGPEWPMGQLTPMKFISRKNKGEMVIYSFEDFETGNRRDIVQYY